MADSEASHRENSDIYENYCVRPDIIIMQQQQQQQQQQQPITSQPSNEEGDLINRPITASSSAAANVGSDVTTSDGDGDDDDDGGEKAGREWRRRRRTGEAEGVYSLEGERGKREWTSGLFQSMTRRPPNRKLVNHVLLAVKDCCCVPCMMCAMAGRLGDPPYLPFLPCTGPALRLKVRILGAITGSIGRDCVVTSCCWPCAVCQMYRELEHIGI
ncbi:uncharacterized protein LOC143297632 [Babylonia areolata]|uniref:uncharacterized protein LOC143297632 n=1 Tax=Babylonia areolata TaxID=304850 RepID=UPI003FD26D03